MTTHPMHLFDPAVNMLTVSMSSSLIPTLPICGNVKVMICPA